MNAVLPHSPIYDVERVADLFGSLFPCAEAIRRSVGSMLDSIPPMPATGFVTFFDPGWSIIRLRNAVAGKGKVFYPQVWYRNEPFSKLEEPPRYQQLRMTAVPDSFNKNFDEQQALLSTDDEIPSARVLVMGMVIHFLATGERLFPDYWVRTTDEGTGGRRISVGCFDAGGLFVSGYWDDYRSDNLGLASSRKF